MKRLLIAVLIPLLLASCGSKSDIADKTIVVGASSTPHALILEEARDYIVEQGYKLKIKVFNDYVTPNISLSDGDLDANYFQHEPYLIDFNANHGTDLVMARKIHFEPMGIYSKKHTDLTSLGGTIAVPNDASNKARAIELLRLNGYDGPTIDVEAPNIPMLLDDCDYALINGNYALSGGVVNYCLTTESSDSEIALTNANGIVCRNGDQDSLTITVLCNALWQDNIKNYIHDTFGSSVIPMF